MSAGKIAEYAVGILIPLGLFWAEERGGFRWEGVGKSTSDSARGSSPESEAERGALPPLRSPFSNLGHHASIRMSRKSSVRAGIPGIPARQNRFSNGSVQVRFRCGAVRPDSDVGSGARFTVVKSGSVQVRFRFATEPETNRY